ncbi:transposase-like protein [Methylobacterium sp. OAE515]
MAKTRREFTPEFKREAVALLESSGRPQMQVAAELGIQPSMLRHWFYIRSRKRAEKAQSSQYLTPPRGGVFFG